MLSRSRAVGKGRGEVVPGVRALALRCSLEKGTHSEPTKATRSSAFASHRGPGRERRWASDTGYRQGAERGG